MWLAPKKISTPNLIDDIEKYLGKSISDKYVTLDSDLKSKVRVLTERLEFVDHLFVFAEFVKRNSSIKNESIEEKTINGDKVRIVKRDFEFILYKKDLAGANFDIEALIFYLLVTCVDTLKGQPTYVDPFDWLKNELDVKNNDIQEHLESLKEKYKEEFGLSRRFKEAFTIDIDSEVQDDLINNLISVKLKSSKINQGSLNAWNERDKAGKLNKIANTLYQIRSSYTHTSIRTFLPSQPLEIVPDLNGEYLLCDSKVRFVNLMKRVIISLTEKIINASLQQ